MCAVAAAGTWGCSWSLLVSQHDVIYIALQSALHSKLD